MSQTINIAIVGTVFGAEFIPIYQCHPAVGSIGICDTDPERLEQIGDKYGIANRFIHLDEVLDSDTFDAVHLLTPVKMHHEQALAVLRSGKHCASAVPMGRSIDELRSLIEEERGSGKNYMMMETAVYGREYFFVADRYRRGDLGELNFLRGVHIQDLDGFPPYWWGYPPMKYATHALAPLLALAGSEAKHVHCYGSGQLPDERIREYDNPYPLETAIFRLDDDKLAAEITASFFHTGRSYQEGFSVYGTKAAFEWQQFEQDDPALFELGPAPAGSRGGVTTEQRVEPSDRADLLPPEIARFSLPTDYDPGTGKSFPVQSHHSGSHPHLVHEFVSSILQGRRARIDSVRAARWCAPGICAHDSAMIGGERVSIPSFVRDSAKVADSGSHG